MHSITSFLNEIAKVIHGIPVGFWQALIASGVLSPAVKAFKHITFTRREKEIGQAAMYSIVVLVAFAGSVFQYLLTTHPSNPKIVLLHTAIVAFLSQPIYLFVVKPLWKFLGNKFGEAALFNAKLKSASVPPEGLPIAGTSISAQTAQDALKSTVTTDNFTS